MNRQIRNAAIVLFNNINKKASQSESKEKVCKVSWVKPGRISRAEQSLAAPFRRRHTWIANKQGIQKNVA